MARENKKVKNATPKTFNETLYRSQLEASMAEEMLNRGILFEYEKFKIILLPAFKYDGTSFRAITYTPDFLVGNTIIECKGWSTDSWKLKRKLAAKWAESNNYRFKEVHSLKELRRVLDEIIERNKLVSK